MPAAPRDFTGRGPQLDALRAALTPAHGASEIATVTGAGGIGKTALMLQAAQQIRAAYPDGQLFADLRGSGNRPAHPADVLTRFLLSLGLRPDAVVADADGLAAQYRTLLADRRVLVVLDDARDADQVRPLLPGAGASGVLVSSRSRLAALEGAHRLSLGPMPQPEAAALFRRIAPPLRAEARLSLPRVLDVCAGLPLAVRIAASRLTADPLLDLRELAHQLSDPARVLDALRLGDLDLRTVLDSCYGALPAASCPNGQGLAPAEALCALGLLPADPAEGGAQAERPVDLAGVAGLVDRPAAAVRRALGVLADVGLLEFRPPDRYLLRPLVAAYARERAIRELAPEEREAALIRLLDRPRHRRHAALRG